jgi:uncharacterized protein DUF5895
MVTSESKAQSKNGSEPQITLADFKSPEFRGGFSKLPGCQLLNDKSKPVLFITDEQLKLAGWKGTDTDGEAYIHTYNDGTEKPGRAFKSPRLLVLLSSPRLIELTKKGAEANPHLGSRGTFIGNYETNPEVRESLEAENKGSTTLRTMHLIHLVNESNQILHPVPLVLSVHGAAAANFGIALEQFYRLLEIAYSQQPTQDGEDEGFYTLNEKVRSLAVFQPVFGFDMVGDKEKSPVCSVKSFLEPDPLDLDSIFCLTQAKKVWGTQVSLGGFASRYTAQFESTGVHAIAPGVDVDPVLDAPTLKSASPLVDYDDDMPPY